MPTLNRNTLKRYERVPKPELSTRPEELYNLKIWKILRNWQITHFPLCSVCLEHGYTTPADDVHHKIPYQKGLNDEERYALFTDVNNLMSVCNKCHTALHKKSYKSNILVLDNLTDKEYAIVHGTYYKD